VTANCQALWACDGGYQTDLTKPFLGADRASWQYPFGSLHRAGARLAMGSDWDVSTPDVFSQIDVAVTRSDVDLPDEPPLNPTEAIDVDDALIGFTSGSAYVNHLDSRTGSVERGKLADLVVLDRNPFAEPRPAGIRVEMTIIEGDVVFRR
jgi:predicted amidohydrolase YtcJ